MEFVKRKLEEWSLLEFYTNFESEGIDEESFKLLDYETIQILFPRAGPRLKFKSYLENFLSASNQSPASPSTQENESSLIELELSSTSLHNMRSPLSEQSIASLPITPDETSKEERLNIQYLVKRKLPEIFDKLQEADPDKINYLHKHKLNRLIVDTYIEKFGCKPTTQEKLQLAKNIIETFPVLKSVEGDGYEQWFSPGTNGVPSSGFIAQRFRNYRQRKLSAVEKAELQVGKKSKSKKSEYVPTLVCGLQDTTAEFQQKQQWLKENDQPIDKVLQFMKETVQGRRYEILNGNANIFEAWPRLLFPQVIDSEFIEIYGEQRSDSLCSEFGLLSNYIILQAKHCGRSAAEELANNENLDLTSSSVSTEKTCCAILLLPFLLPQGVVSRKNGTKKSKIRPTATQSLAHFIQFLPIGEGIEKFMSEDRLLGGDRKQPFILAIGEKFSPNQTFVVVEKHLIEVNSLLKAVDICFKLMYILNLEFSPYCKNVWQFLNDLFYKCECHGETPSCILELKNRLFLVSK